MTNTEADQAENGPLEELPHSMLEAPEYYLAAVNRQNRENMEVALRPFGLKLAEWRILSCLDALPSLAVGDLAELTVVERSVCSRLVDRLTERGLLRKEASEADKRFAEVSLTGKGRTRLRATGPAIEDLRAQLFTGLSPDDHETLLRLLRSMRKNSLAYRPVPLSLLGS